MALSVLRWNGFEHDGREYSLVAHAKDKMDAIYAATDAVSIARLKILTFMEDNEPLVSPFDSPYATSSFAIIAGEADATGRFRLPA